MFPQRCAENQIDPIRFCLKKITKCHGQELDLHFLQFQFGLLLGVFDRVVARLTCLVSRVGSCTYVKISDIVRVY